MLAQTTELIDKGQTFAERFGWEALVIIVVLGFLGALIWRVGGRVATSISNFLEASITQLRAQAETQSKTSEAITLLSASNAASADLQRRVEECATDTHLKVDKLLRALLEAARIAYDSIPDDAQEAKGKLLRVIRDLEK
jgi:hypothetical protein